MTETNLRQADADLNVEGILSEKSLEVVVEDGMKKIKGYLTLKTSDINFVRINVNAAEKTREGNESRSYPGVETVMNEYKTIADVGEEMADRVRCRAQINPYKNLQNGQEVVSYRGNFFNRVTGAFEPKAEIDVELFIQAITPEVDRSGEETGRMIVKGWMPTYNGIEPLQMIADEDIADAVASNFDPGQTARFYGEAINSRVETYKPVIIGKPKVEYTTKSEIKLTGAEAPYDEESPKAYKADVIKAAIQEREDRYNARKAGAAPQKAAKPSGQSRGRSVSW